MTHHGIQYIESHYVANQLLTQYSQISPIIFIQPHKLVVQQLETTHTKFYKLLQIVTNCYKLLQIVTNCYKLWQIVTNSYKLLQIVTNCYKWLQIVTNCYKWLKLVTNGYKWLQTVTNCYKLPTNSILRFASFWPLCRVGKSPGEPKNKIHTWI